LKLTRGFGLVVDTVEPDSAAANAGVERYDILQKLNDQILVNSSQLGVLVRSMKPGDAVALTVLRAGQPMTLNATLTEKELPVLSEGSWNAADGLGVRVFGDATGNFAFTPGAAVMPQIGEFKFDAGGGQHLFQMFPGEIDGENQSVYQDSEMTLRVTTKDGARTLVAEDQAGTTLFEGPIDTDAQKERLPGQVADKLKRFEERLMKIDVEKGGTIRVRVIEP
jgi:hypothetical protein